MIHGGFLALSPSAAACQARLRGRVQEAGKVLAQVAGLQEAEQELAGILAAGEEGQAPLAAVFAREQRRPLTIAIGLSPPDLAITWHQANGEPGKTP